MLQVPMKAILFLLPAHYKTIQQDGEMNIQYQKEIAAKFIKQKHNSNTSHQECPIKIYSGGSSHESFFILQLKDLELVNKKNLVQKLHKRTQQRTLYRIVYFIYSD